jgi:hypothetical protein
MNMYGYGRPRPGYLGCGCAVGYCGCNDNVGEIGIDTSGDLTIGIGGGLAVDLADGDIVVDIPGTNIGIDTGW